MSETLIDVLFRLKHHEERVNWTKDLIQSATDFVLYSDVAQLIAQYTVPLFCKLKTTKICQGSGCQKKPEFGFLHTISHCRQHQFPHMSHQTELVRQLKASLNAK